MEKVFEFLRKHKDVAFSTVENNRPKIRVFQVMKIDGRNLYFATSARKEVYAQLVKNPAIELLAMEGNVSVRISGDTVFDVDDAVAREIYEENLVLPRLYASYKDLVYFRLPIRSMDYYDLTPTPPEQKHIEYGQE